MGEVRAPATRLYARAGRIYRALEGVSRNPERWREPDSVLSVLAGSCVAVASTPTDAGVNEVINVAVQDC